MPAKPVARPAPRAQVVEAQVNDIKGANRMTGQLADQVNAQAQDPRSILANVDLAIGENRITTGLSRRARGCNLTPTVANAAFAWSFAPSGDRQAIITVIGADQPGACLEFY